MAKNMAEFDNLGKTKMEFLKSTEGKLDAFVDDQNKQDGVDPYGDDCAKERDTMDMNSATAFTQAFITKVDAMGSDYAKTKAQRGEIEGRDDMFAVGSVDAFGDDAGKKASGQTTKRK